MLTKIIILVNNSFIYLNPTIAVPIQDTNIPYQYLKFRSTEKIYWLVELVEYNIETLCWKMKVIDYSASTIENFPRQKPTKTVKRIAFEKFKWNKIEPLLSSYKKIELNEVIENHNTDKFFNEQTSESNKFRGPDVSKIDFSPIILEDIKPIVRIYKDMFQINISEVYFKLGYVTLSKRLKGFKNPMNFRIENSNILSEFENIKPWFAKKLKTKKITVAFEITYIDNEITKIIASSTEIDKIDSNFIDSIKYQRTLELTKPKIEPSIDKSIFTAEEIFNEFEDKDMRGNVFNQSEQDILRTFLEKQNTRNKNHLVYLSGSKQSENHKLRFTLHPNFGFLFLVEGNENNHFVWELLNSHATYIWSIDKLSQNIELQYKRIEATINTIRENGRERYKRDYRINHHDHDLVFSVIEHAAIESDFVDGFVKWEYRLNERLT